ncbi:MAG: ATP-binding cassette domain-containing protein [Oscillospiraceae bacterium]
MSAIGQSIKINNVSKLYGSFQALDQVSLEAEAGEFLTILGSSGSGKTTLLKIIAGFEASSGGSILINGENVAGKKSYERNIGNR